VTPILGAATTSLTQSEWEMFNEKFSAYETWLHGKAGLAVEALGFDRIKQILAATARRLAG